MQDQSTRQEARGRDAGDAEQAQRGQGLRREANKQTSAPSGSSPTPQTLAGPRPGGQEARRPGGVRPAEKQGAIHSCCLQNLGLQSLGQAPRLRFHSNVTPQAPSKEIRPRAPPTRPRELGKRLTPLTPTPSLRRGPYISPQPPSSLQQPSSFFTSTNVSVQKAWRHLLRNLVALRKHLLGL